MERTRRKLITAAVAVIVAALACVTIWRMLPCSANTMRRTAAIVEYTTWEEIAVDGKPLLFFDHAEGDTAVIGVTTTRDSAPHRHYSTGCWVNRLPLIPSCGGRLASVISVWQNSLKGIADTTLLSLCDAAVRRELKAMGNQKSELDYYMRVHGVQDMGYQQIAALSAKVNAEYAAVEKARHIIDSLSAGKHSITVRLKTEYVAVSRNDEGKLIRTPLQLLSFDRTTGIALLRTADNATPDGACAADLLPWNAGGEKALRAVGFPGIGESGLECDSVSPLITPGQSLRGGRHDLPQMLAGDGTPVFSAKGRFLGIVCGDSLKGRHSLSKLLFK